MKPQNKEEIEGVLIGIIGFILFIDFASVDASIFNFTAPEWITRISNLFSVSPLWIDILTTLVLILIIAMMHTEREIGQFNERKRGRK